MFQKIVVGIDGSKTAENALVMACDIAKRYGAELHLVHTPQPLTVVYATGVAAAFPVAMPTPTAQELRDAAKKVVDAGLATAKDCGAEVKATYDDPGEPADQIMACAKACGADLIVTGRRGLGNLGALVLGSTSQMINHASECACLTVA